MKRFTPTLFILVFLFCSCEENAVDPFPSNTYTGIFFRTIDGVQQDTSAVHLELKDNSFRGKSSKLHYPAIGTGSYCVQNNSIIFMDGTPWFADFEWTYILKDTFSIHKEDGQFILTKEIGSTIVDTYVLEEGVGE